MSQELMEELVKDPEFLDQFKSWEDVMSFLHLAMTEGIAIPASRNGVDSGAREGGQAKLPDGLLAAMNKPGQKPFSYLGGVDLKQQLQGMKERRRQAIQESAKAKAAKAPATKAPELHAPISARPAPATITSSKNTTCPPLSSGAVDRVQAQYNSPMPVYSNENIKEAFVAQAGGATQGLQERPKKDESDVARFIRESESGGRPGPHAGEDGEFRGGSAANKQSMSFRVLQWMTETDKDEEDTDALRRKKEKDPEFRHNAEDDEMRFSGLNRGTGIPSKSFSRLQKLTVNDQETQSQNKQFLSPNGGENEDGDVGKYDETSIRYKGKYIPSPAFRVLQNWADHDPLEVTTDPSEKVPDRRDKEDVQNPDQVADERRYKGGNIPSRVFKTLQMAVGDEQGSDKETSSAPTTSTNQTSGTPRGIRVIQKTNESSGSTDF